MNTIEEIKDLEEKLRQAELGPDAKFFEDHLADDALLDGKKAKQMVVEAHKPNGSAKFTKADMSDYVIIPHGPDAAVVTCTGAFEGKMGAFTLKFMRVWVRNNGRWQIVAGTVAK